MLLRIRGDAAKDIEIMKNHRSADDRYDLDTVEVIRGGS
jgi:hypothetical protein